MSKRTSKFEVYRDSSNYWRWRFVAPNGKVLADSGQGYSRRIDALKGILSVRGAARFVNIPEADRGRYDTKLWIEDFWGTPTPVIIFPV